MIDVGRGAYPAFTDFDADGLTDLVVACKERYYGPGNTPFLLARFRNVGTETAPAFEQLDTNWLSLPDFRWKAWFPRSETSMATETRTSSSATSWGNLHLWTNVADAGDPR